MKVVVKIMGYGSVYIIPSTVRSRQGEFEEYDCLADAIDNTDEFAAENGGWCIDKSLVNEPCRISFVEEDGVFYDLSSEY